LHRKGEINMAGKLNTVPPDLLAKIARITHNPELTERDVMAFLDGPHAEEQLGRGDFRSLKDLFPGQGAMR
jgi:hypothetical protein